jgi:hypothetical protein
MSAIHYTIVLKKKIWILFSFFSVIFLQINKIKQGEE